MATAGFLAMLNSALACSGSLWEQFEEHRLQTVEAPTKRRIGRWQPMGHQSTAACLNQATFGVEPSQRWWLRGHGRLSGALGRDQPVVVC